jgi:hypothetical protein
VLEWCMQHPTYLVQQRRCRGDSKVHGPQPTAACDGCGGREGRAPSHCDQGGLSLRGCHQACTPESVGRSLADRRSDQHGDGIAVGEMSERGGGQQRTCQPFWPSLIHGAAAGVILPASPMDCLLLPYRPTPARLPLPARAGVLGHSTCESTAVIRWIMVAWSRRGVRVSGQQLCML